MLTTLDFSSSLAFTQFAEEKLLELVENNLFAVKYLDGLEAKCGTT